MAQVAKVCVGMATTELLRTMALMESSHKHVKAGYALDYTSMGIVAVMSELAPRFGKTPSEMHT